ncbi:hypothetical protein GGR69_003829 [Xanthomonas arboricola]|nr:hypothetical protein [Xanthomonas arboricola]
MKHGLRDSMLEVTGVRCAAHAQQSRNFAADPGVRGTLMTVLGHRTRDMPHDLAVLPVRHHVSPRSVEPRAVAGLFKQLRRTQALMQRYAMPGRSGLFQRQIERKHDRKDDDQADGDTSPS